MAREIVLPDPGGRVVLRNPWAVLGLTVITLGIYSWFWWFFINAEMRDLGRVRGVDGLGHSPGMSTLAYVAGGWLLIPIIWTTVTTCRRVQRSQELVGARGRLSGWIVLLLAIVTLGIGIAVYMQANLNKTWNALEGENRPSAG